MEAEKHTVRMTWRERMTFDAITTTGHHLTVDSLPEHGGNERGPRPLELLLAGLAGCSAMDVISVLHKKREPVLGLEVEVEGTRAVEHPMIYTDISMVYRVKGKVSPASVARAIELSIGKYCGAYAMLSRSARMTSRFEIDDGEGPEEGVEREFGLQPVA